MEQYFHEFITIHERRYSSYKERASIVGHYERVVATSKGIGKLLAKFDRHIAKDELESHVRIARIDYTGDTFENNLAFEDALLEDKRRELTSDS